MENLEIVRKLKSVELCLSAHPDFETGSEFEDRVLDLQEIQKALKIPVVVGRSEQLTCKHCGFWESKHLQGKYCPDRNNSEFKAS